MEITKEWIDQQRALCDSATPGPWMCGYTTHGSEPAIMRKRSPDIIARRVKSMGMYNKPRGETGDAEFIAAARTSLPVALDALEAAQKELSAQRIAFQKLYGNHQRGISPKVIACPICGGIDDVRLMQRQDADSVIVHRLLVTDGMDADVADALEGKRDVQDALMEALKAKIEKARGT